jgi:hypothetical protein
MAVHVETVHKQCCHFQYSDPYNRGLRSQSTKKMAEQIRNNVLFSEMKPFGSRNILDYYIPVCYKILMMMMMMTI